jgi:hypothetical protein
VSIFYSLHYHCSGFCVAVFWKVRKKIAAQSRKCRDNLVATSLVQLSFREPIIPRGSDIHYKIKKSMLTCKVLQHLATHTHTHTFYLVRQQCISVVSQIHPVHYPSIIHIDQLRSDIELQVSHALQSGGRAKPHLPVVLRHTAHRVGELQSNHSTGWRHRPLLRLRLRLPSIHWLGADRHDESASVSVCCVAISRRA